MRSKKYSYYLQVILALSLFMTSFTSCQFEELSEDCNKKGLIILNLGLDGMSTRAGNLFEGTGYEVDEVINKVRIFVFVGEALEINNLYTSGEDLFTNPFILEVSTGTKDIYVVANESGTLETSLASVSSKSGLLGIMSESITEITGPLELPLVMTGNRTGVTVDVVEGTDRNTTEVVLTRIASKISLRFKKATIQDVLITKVSLIKNAGVTTIWENGVLNDGENNWNWNHTLDIALPLSSDLAAINDFENIYLYENLTNGDKSKATQLEVEALYNGVPTKYRVYINENISSPGSGNAGDPSSSVTNPSDHLYSTKRNHHYQLNGTIAGIGEFDGLTLTTNVLPWNALPSYISFERKFTINPTPTLANHTYTVDSNGEVKFTFKLTSPIDASWVANLTLVGGFEFVGANQGLTDEEVVITIKANNPPGEEEQVTEFYINVGYGGNWSEIPLLSGSNLIGVGNRVVIRQPAI